MDEHSKGRDDIGKTKVDISAERLVNEMRKLDLAQLNTFYQLVAIVQPKPGEPAREPIINVFRALNRLCRDIGLEQK